MGTTTRSAYDGLQRLTGATETPGTTYDYTYDLAGNRTEVWENDTLVADLRYNDANQVIGWSYDAAGNLLSDGTTTRSYDALNRLVAHDSASYAYNGDGVLVSDGTTTYAQDLAAPLSQVLSDGTANYLYGHDRLRALGGPWYVGDALGSVRQTLDDAGAVLGSMQYDPWGVPTAGTPQPFGFTGELHSAGQVYLRARWYAPGQGRFVSEDPFAGFPEMPYSLHAYQYAYSDPIYKTDPSGLCVPEYRRLVTFRGRQYLVTGGDPGCKPVWDIGQGLNWKDWGDYNWAVFEGMGSPGAWVIDQFCGTNEFERIWSDPSRGHVSGAAFGVAAVGAGLFKYIVSPLARHIAAGGTGVETVRQNAENLSRSAEAIDGVITQGTSSAPAMPSGADPYTELSQKFIEIATSDPKINCWNCTLKTFGYEDIENVEELYRILDQNFVPTSSPRPGDLVLWEMEPLPLEPGEPTLRRPFHMALYAGDDSGGQYLSYSLTSGGKKSTEPAAVYTLSELAEINEAIKTYTPQYYRLQP